MCQPRVVRIPHALRDQFLQVCVANGGSLFGVLVSRSARPCGPRQAYRSVASYFLQSQWRRSLAVVMAHHHQQTVCHYVLSALKTALL